MTLTASMSAKQAFAGAPIDVSAAVRSDDPNTDLANSPHAFLGVTSGSGAPATYAGLAQHDNGGGTSDVYSSALWDNMASSQVLSSGGGVGGPNNVQFSLRRLERLGTFTAGQYLWLWVSNGAGYPAGGDAPAALAGPYHII